MEKISIIDFGSQYTQLIARRVRELSVYSEIIPFTNFSNIDPNTKGIILSGGPCSVTDSNAPNIETSKIRGKVPILGLCYGAQLLALQSGGNIIKSEIREFGRANLTLVENSELLNGVDVDSQVWMSHGDTITSISKGNQIIASTSEVKIAGFSINSENTYGLQFHPEVYHSTDGVKILDNFLSKICKCSKSWTMESFISKSVSDIKNQVGNDKVLLGLSGGVDSSVAALLLHKAIGKNLFCFFINNGLLRKNEYEDVLNSYQSIGLNIQGINSEKVFLDALEGISDPELKRKIIGKKFVEIFETKAISIGGVKWLAQGTVYPDVIESISATGGPSAKIKSHHNVGGLPEKMNLKIIEPLREIFKDEVRKVGRNLGLDEKILNRHPFPGPGLSIRIIGEINKRNLKILREVDHIFIDSLVKHKLYDKVWQAGAMFLPIRTVGVMGDERTYENVVSLRAVTSTDGMTADWAHLPSNFLSDVSNKIINKVKGVNRVVYDISSKPPATIEWE
ncbi:MAG: glutamine-hydrolyzing GMP synthase [Bacteroidota bacterium]|nr:glutamine-hydrolyzing GMP synthase [Bacteroidota bacterium]